MSSVVISGDISGSVTLDAPSVAGTTVLTLPATSGTVVTTATTTGISGSAITTGTVGVSVGGTGANTLTANNVILGNGTSAVQFVAPGSTGNVLFTTNGTTWSSTAKIVSDTAQTATSTSVNFTGIPSWVKRITVMLIGVSTSGTSAIIVQLGTGATPTYTTSGYVGYGTNFASTSNSITSVTVGLPFSGISVAGNTYTASNTITSYGTNNWMGVAICPGGSTIVGSGTGYGSGYIALGAVLTAVRITTVNGTDTFDAGTINIMYE